jgi:hypothetical protein
LAKAVSQTSSLSVVVDHQVGSVAVVVVLAECWLRAKFILQQVLIPLLLVLAVQLMGKVIHPV